MPYGYTQQAWNALPQAQRTAAATKGGLKPTASATPIFGSGVDPILRKPGTAALGGGGAYIAPGGGGAGAAGAGAVAGGGTPTVTPDFGAGRPTGPDIPAYNLNQDQPPELVAARQRAESYLGNLEKGTGVAADVMHGQMQDQVDADIQRARETAAAQGIPFDEAQARRDAQAKIFGAEAAQRTAREELQGRQIAGMLPTIGAGSAAQLEKNKLELERQSTPVQQALQRFSTQAGMYGSELGTAANVYSTNKNTEIAAMNAMNDWLKSAFSFSA